MLNLFWSWLSGYVLLHLTGGGQERFLNLALQREIEIWDINWLRDDLLELKAAWGDLKELRRVGKICGCKLAIRRSRGLPFTIHYLRGRKTLAVGIILFAAGLFALSQLVFAVKVLPQEELHELDVAQVESLAAELGLKPGVLFARLDTDALAAELKSQIPEISWVYIERNGTVVNIKVAERSIYPEELENATKGAIWADRNALVEQVLLKHGQPMVERGDTVKKGDLLVAPLADGRADAIVRGRVWYQGYGEAALEQEEVTPDGRPAYLYRLTRADGRELLLWGQTPKTPEDGGQISSQTADFTFNIFGTAVDLQREALQRELITQRQLSEQEAKAAAYRQAEQTLSAQMGEDAKRLNEETAYQLLPEGVWSVNVTWECLEEIGIHTQAETQN